MYLKSIITLVVSIPLTSRDVLNETVLRPIFPFSENRGKGAKPLDSKFSDAPPTTFLAGRSYPFLVSAGDEGLHELVETALTVLDGKVVANPIEAPRTRTSLELTCRKHKNLTPDVVVLPPPSSIKMDLFST